MSAVTVVLNPMRPEAVDAARRACRWLVDRGHEPRLPEDDARSAGLDDHAVADDALADGPVLALSLGGDGTMLRTVALVAGAEVPVIGVNLGQLGYLTEVEPAGLESALERFFAGQHRIEARMLLEVRVEAASVPASAARSLALNEAVLEKTLSGHTVRLDVAIDGEPFTPYETDGLIVATPTGSTAYAFSARGPIVAPTHRALLLTPVSPHMLFDRTLVLEPGTEVRMGVSGHRPAALSVDGRPVATLGHGDAVVCRAAAEQLRLVTLSPRDFPQILKAKFRLPDR